jgi:hypothetical protein
MITLTGFLLGSPTDAGQGGHRYLLLGLAQQLIGELLIDQGPPGRRMAVSGFAGHHRSV